MCNKALRIIKGILSTDGMGVSKIINTDTGTWPKTIAVTARYLLSSFFTIAFQTACRNAAKIMAKNIFRGMIYIVFKRQLIQYKFRII
tara:strand:+ start:167 stop:430 length:264 start_codon:yes stop_codon:yes gene_type:complete